MSKAKINICAQIKGKLRLQLGYIVHIRNHCQPLSPKFFFFHIPSQPTARWCELMYLFLLVLTPSKVVLLNLCVITALDVKWPCLMGSLLSFENTNFYMTSQNSSIIAFMKYWKNNFMVGVIKTWANVLKCRWVRKVENHSSKESHFLHWSTYGFFSLMQQFTLSV